MATVYVASKNMRGRWAQPPQADAVKVDVTSAQSKSNPNRAAFSPMTDRPHADAHEGIFPNFEAYWQSLKVIENVNHDESKLWWKTITKPKRRHPKQKKNRVLHALHKRYPGMQLDYVTSRKLVYVPDYAERVADNATLRSIKRKHDEGASVVVYDFDGPRDTEGNPVCLPVTANLLKQKIEDESHPFGHGYVVAALIAGIDTATYTHE
jgi:hypothetical protein